MLLLTDFKPIVLCTQLAKNQIIYYLKGQRLNFLYAFSWIST